MKKRVVIIADAVDHIGPDLAKALAARDHNLVLGGASQSLVDELNALGAEVAIVPHVSSGKDLTRPEAIQSLVDSAGSHFGGFSAAFIRPAVHMVGDILTATAEDVREAFEGNMMASFYALQTLIKSLVEQGSGGQILVGSSGTGAKPYPGALAYCSTKAGAIMMIRAAAQTAAPHGISINAIGTMALNYSGFLDSSGCNDPDVLEQFLKQIPQGRLGETQECAHLAASMLDGKCHFMSGEFLSLSGGWTSV